MPDFKVKLKMHQINFGWGSAPDLAGAYRGGIQGGEREERERNAGGTGEKRREGRRERRNWGDFSVYL